MNKKHFAYCAVGVLGLYLGAVAIVNQSDKNLAARNMAKYEHFDKETLDYQAASVLSNAGCGYCHTADSEMPFYKDLPIANRLMDADLERGMRHFDMTDLFDDLANNRPVSEVALVESMA